MGQKPENERKPKHKKQHGSSQKGHKGKRKDVFPERSKSNTREKKEIEILKENLSKLAELNPDECDSFDPFPISVPTKKGLKEAGYVVPTKVQRQSLVHSLSGIDVVAAAKTGSGKTLAFLIPMLELLYSKMWSTTDGLGALVITPTRELAYQIYEVLNKIGKYHQFSVGLVIGGKDLKFERKRVGGCNIMICTPGRLLQHMTENPDFDWVNMQIVVLDEADMCLSMGFSEQMNMILEELPKDRQTLLFSATQTRDVKDLVRAGCRNPVFVSSHERSKTATPKTLSSSYYVCSEHDKVTFLWSFLSHHRHKKLLVFFSTCKQVNYFFNLFCKLHPGISVMAIHGGMHQLKRMGVYDRFTKERKAVLFATDVAARGLDIPAVSWVVQMDCPEDVTTYIHRVGRTARNLEEGEALLVTTPYQEEEMVKALRANNIPIEQIKVDDNYLTGVHQKIEGILGKYSNLKEDAVRAFKSYLKSVFMMKNKRVFNVETIDADAYARSLGLAVTPRVRFIERKQKNKKNSKLNEEHTDDQDIEGAAQAPRTTFDFGASDSGEESNEDFLTSSTNTKKIEERLKEDEAYEEDILNSKPGKVVTKYAVVKKMRKRGAVTNTKVVFDAEGNVVLDPLKSHISDLAKSESGTTIVGTLDIEKLKEVIRSEDKVDKQVENFRIREKARRKLEKEKARKEQNNEKEEDDIDGELPYEEDSDFSDYSVDEDFLNGLPDPDQIYGSKTESDEDPEFFTPSSTKRQQNESKSVSKRSRTEDTSPSSPKSTKKKKKKSLKEDEALPGALPKPKVSSIDKTISKLDVAEKEDLALMLLRGGS